MNTHDSRANQRSIIDALRDQIEATPMPFLPTFGFSRPPRVWLGVRRPRIVAGASVGLAAATIVLVLGLSAASGPPPAVAAALNPNGTVTITLRQITRYRELNAKLAALGTRIRAVPVVSGCVAPVHTVSNGLVVPGPARTLEVSSQGPGALVSMTIAVDTIPGRTFVVAVTKSGLEGIDGVVVGSAPPCVGSAAISSANPFLLPSR